MRALVAMLLASCTSAVPIGATSQRASELYCFTADVKSKRGKQAVGCFDTEPLCREALGSAMRWGRMAGVQRLTPCERRGAP